MSWMPIAPGLTSHGLRHSHQTWLEDGGIHYFLISERMGHLVGGMRGVYGHVTPEMRTAAKDLLQHLWEGSLERRLTLSSGSVVPVLDRLLRGVEKASRE
jgi:hypothetical protein